MHAVIETVDLTKTYGKTRGIEHVNLAVEPGEIFGFIGPNGAGKSTTIRTLLGLMRPTAGRALLFGESCVTHPGIRREVGYLPAEVFYYDRMRVADLLRYSASFYHKDCTARIRELAQTLELTTPQDRRPLFWQPQKGRHRPEPAPRAEAAYPRRPHQRAGPADAAEIFRAFTSGEPQGRHGFLFLPHPQRDAEAVQPGCLHPAGCSPCTCSAR